MVNRKMIAVIAYAVLVLVGLYGLFSTGTSLLGTNALPLQDDLVNVVCDVTVKNTLFVASNIQSATCNVEKAGFLCAFTTPLSILSDDLTLEMRVEGTASHESFSVGEGSSKTISIKRSCVQPTGDIDFTLKEDNAVVDTLTQFYGGA